MRLKGKKTPVRKRPAPKIEKPVAPVTSRPSPGGSVDPVLVLLIVLLTCTGVVMVFSASGVFSYVKLQDSTFFLKQQIKWLVIAGVALLFTSVFDYRYYRKMALPMLGFVFFLLMIVPFVGQEINGAKRWLSLGGFNFHIGELAKTVAIIFMAVYLAASGRKIQDIKYFGIAIGIVMLTGLLLLLQPDFGMTALISIVCLGMLYVAGARPLHLAGICATGMVACVPLVLIKPYRMNRILGYLHPELDPLGVGWQKIQSMIAIANGGFFGRGLGNSIQKRMFLPQQHTDFIYSIIGEELGMIGMLFVAALFVLISIRGLRIAERCADPLGRNLVTGIVWMISLQAALNMGVAVGLFPITGLTLPCISFGGASLTCTFICFGIMLNVSAHVSRKSRRLDVQNSPGGGGDGGTYISRRGSRPVHTEQCAGVAGVRRGKARRARAVGGGR